MSKNERAMTVAASTSGLSLNLRTLQLEGPHGWVDVTDPESRLLKAFAASADRRLDTASMLAQVGKTGDRAGKRALEVQLVRLRKKLVQAGAPVPILKSIRGRGYQLCVPLEIHPSFS